MTEIELTSEQIEAHLKAKEKNLLDDAVTEVLAKSDTLAQTAASPPPTPADTVMMMAQTKTAQQFLLALIALCMQAEADGGEVMFFSKRGRARFTVTNMKIRHGQTMNFFGEGDNLFTASADLHTRITGYMNDTNPNAVPPGDSAKAGEVGDASASPSAAPVDPPAGP